MWENLLQQDVPVVGIVAATAALFLFRKAAHSMKNIKSKPVVGSSMLLVGLTTLGMSVGELTIKPADKDQSASHVALATYEGEDMPEMKPEGLVDKRYVPNQLAGGALALAGGLIVCGLATTLRGWKDV